MVLGDDLSNRQVSEIERLINELRKGGLACPRSASHQYIRYFPKCTFLRDHSIVDYNNIYDKLYIDKEIEVIKLSHPSNS